MLEECSGEYLSGLVLVPYHDRVKKFMDTWGEAAQTETWKEEHEAEVGSSYQCTCDYRALNLKSKSDVFPIPRIDDCWIRYRGAHVTFWLERCRTHSGQYDWQIGAEKRQSSGHMISTFSGCYSLRSGRERPTIGPEWWLRCLMGYQNVCMTHSKEFGEHYRTLGRI